MNAKQKANELVDRYVEYVEAYSSQGQIENAKTCALIAVE
jgi:predicted Ser/Thr protein kinase